MEKYFVTDPDEGSFFISITDLDDDMKDSLIKLLNKYNVDLEIEAYIEEDIKYKYICDAPCYQSKCCDEVCNLLILSGYKAKGWHNYLSD
jgi:hypothetical protein